MPLLPAEIRRSGLKEMASSTSIWCISEPCLWVLRRRPFVESLGALFVGGGVPVGLLFVEGGAVLPWAVSRAAVPSFSIVGEMSSRTRSPEGRTSPSPARSSGSAGRGRRASASSTGHPESAGMARPGSVSSTGRRELGEDRERTPSASSRRGSLPGSTSPESERPRSAEGRPTSSAAEGLQNSLSRPGSAESTSSGGRRKSVAVDSLPKLFGEEEFSRPRLRPAALHEQTESRIHTG